MITLQDLFQHLEQLFFLPGIGDSCPNGLQVEGKKEIKKIGCAVSASLEAIEAAVDFGADALIVHHGLFWQKDPFEVKGVKKSKLALLLKNDLSLFAYHLPLDAHRQLGNNWKAAQDLGWQQMEPFGEVGQIPIGVKGKFSKRPIEKFVKEVETYYNHPAYLALGGKKEVGSAAMISGGAYRYLDQAADAEVDCFITGNFDEPAWNTAFERKIHFLALGHHATEVVGIKALAGHLTKQFKIECAFFNVRNPF